MEETGVATQAPTVRGRVVSEELLRRGILPGNLLREDQGPEESTPERGRGRTPDRVRGRHGGDDEPVPKKLQGARLPKMVQTFGQALKLHRWGEISKEGSPSDLVQNTLKEKIRRCSFISN